MQQFKLEELEKPLKAGIPIGTVFDYVSKDPHKYANDELANYIIANPEEWHERINRLGLKRGYFKHLGGTFILNKLFEFGIPEYFITKYIVYPLTYQFRTHMPFLNGIKVAKGWPTFKYCSSPILEEYFGVNNMLRGDLGLPVVRYAVPGAGTEYEATEEKFCGTFYYPEAKSDIILKYKSVLVVPNKIVAYSYLFKTGIEEIAPKFVKIGEYSYIEDPMDFKIRGDGFKEYYIDLNQEDLTKTYDLVKSNLSESLDKLIEMVYSIYDLPDYLNELNRKVEGEGGDIISYEYRGEIQDRDLILFIISYVRYVAIKMIIAGTWNWRIPIFGPYVYYDQLICDKAHQLNIDLVIFTTEFSTGIYRIRTEILDTRDREVTYGSLYIKNDPLVLKQRQNEKIELEQALSQQQLQ